MRFIPTLVLCGCATAALAQTAAPVTVTKDSQAVKLMTQMIIATGWSTASLPSDAVLSGTITHYEPTETTLSLKMETTGPSQLRLEINDGNSPKTTIVNSGEGAVIRPNSTHSLPTHSALAMRPIHLPFFSGLSAWSDPAISVAYKNVETVNGQQAYRISLTRPNITADAMGTLLARASWMDVWISQQSMLPVQISYEQIGTANPNARFVEVAQFSDFRNVGGLLVPFHQEIYLGSRHLFSLQVSTVQFNVGVSATDFALPLGH